MPNTQHNEKFTFADLFAGVGGMRIAFESVGGRCVLTSEIDEKAMETYATNFPEEDDHNFIADVNKIRLQDVSFPMEVLDVLVAGFPCQPYSIAGLRKGLEDDRGGEIFNSLVRILGELKPRSFLLENVKGIRNHDGGQTFSYMLERLEKAGYHLRHETLNSATHGGVPQNRERVFIVGFRDPSSAERFEFPSEIPLETDFRDLLERQVGQKYFYDNRFGAFPEIQSKVVRNDTIYQWRRQYVRENKSGVCPTLTANMGSGGHNVPLLLDGKKIRKLTPRETARLQGFPDTFELPEISDAHLYHQFGNSVTVPLIERIAKSFTIALGVEKHGNVNKELG
jgi:DNA (cytosine-5)-methyltransferase 1